MMQALVNYPRAAHTCADMTLILMIFVALLLQLPLLRFWRARALGGA